MPKAVWEDTVIAQSDRCVVVEGNQYFPADAVRSEHLRPASQTTVCGWKGVANYYDVVVDGKVNTGAAWYYADPKSAASEIKGHVAFWKGVRVLPD
jgi:uncharacterized protein (DUF427 family)